MALNYINWNLSIDCDRWWLEPVMNHPCGVILVGCERGVAPVQWKGADGPQKKEACGLAGSVILSVYGCRLWRMGHDPLGELPNAVIKGLMVYSF